MNGTLVTALIGAVGGLGALALGVLNLVAGRGGQRADEASTLTRTGLDLLKEVKEQCDECKESLDVAIEKAEDAEQRAVAAEQRASAAEQRAAAAERRADRNDRTSASLIDAWDQALPLLAADAEATKFLRATIRVARQARYEDEP